MRRANKTHRKGIATLDLGAWSAVNIFSLSESDRACYERREQAVKMYASHYSLAEIHRCTGISKQRLYHLVSRCLLVDGDGNQAGFRALIPRQHLPAIRNEGTKKLRSIKPAPGSLHALFFRYPSIYSVLHQLAVLGKRDKMQAREVDVPIASIHAEFIKQCEIAGIKYPHYPFNSESVGLPAIKRWVKTERAEHRLRNLRIDDPTAAIKVQSTPIAKMTAGPSRVFQRVELDGHRIDLECVLEMPGPNGEGVVRVFVSRIWILALVEAKSNAVLGYTLAFGQNYSAVDAMRAVRNSVVPWRRRQLTVTTVDYREGDGLPSGLINELSYACFDELHLDNALAHLSDFFLSQLERTVNAVPVFGPVQDPDSRPFVEGFFRLFEEAGLHRMIGTTGSDPKDRRRRDHKDTRYHLTLDLLTDLVDLLIARINNSRAPSASITRLDVLRRALMQTPTVIRRIPVDLRSKVFQYDMHFEATIGSDHKRPVVRALSARYSNDVLAKAFGLIGRRVTVLANSEDVRTVECILDNGSSLGTLFVERRWRQTAHSLITRREITRLVNKGVIKDTNDLPVKFRQHLEIQARKSRRAAAMLAKVRLEQGESILAEKATGLTHEVQFPASEELAVKAVDDNGLLADIEELLKNVRTQY